MTELDPALAETGREESIRLLREMLRIRRFEEKCAELYTQMKIRGFLHLYIGEEAVAVGAVGCLRAEDAIFATYREHGHALARGVPARAIMAEMYGTATGCSRGRGGSMHLFDASRRFYGGSAIVGGGLPLAAGYALAEKLRGRDNIAACFFGEGAIAEGEFHESMNLSGLWGLPVLFFCENNLYAMGTALARSESQIDLIEKAQSYRIAAESVDGMNILAVRDATRRALEYIRAGHGPYFLEFRTYRFRAHSMFDPELYRDKFEVQAWKKHCPIADFSGQLMRVGWLAQADLDAIEHGIASEIVDAIEFSEASPWEKVEDLARFVYSEKTLA
jgi:pyruvate dehydrogenase E1 component alpha subunit